jgi:hypothetical protein
MDGHPDDFHLSTRDVDGEQHVVANQPEPGHRLNGEEVHPHDHAQVCPTLPTAFVPHP